MFLGQILCTGWHGMEQNSCVRPCSLPLLLFLVCALYSSFSSYLTFSLFPGWSCSLLFLHFPLLLFPPFPFFLVQSWIYVFKVCSGKFFNSSKHIFNFSFLGLKWLSMQKKELKKKVETWTRWCTRQTVHFWLFVAKSVEPFFIFLFLGIVEHIALHCSLAYTIVFEFYWHIKF